MKILSVAQTREADAYTIQHEPILSADLMERAARACAGWLSAHISREQPVRVFCGMGNNGGDGLALSRLLLADGYQVTAYKVHHAPKASDDFKANEERLKELKPLTDVRHHDDFPPCTPGEVWVDALFGSGLNRPLEGLAAELIRYINDSSAEVIAIDLPSGLFGEDNDGNLDHPIIQASHTLTFQYPKLALLFPRNEVFAGQWHILDIGLHAGFLEKVSSDHEWVTGEDVCSLLKPRKRFSHKGTFGHALLMAGSEGKMGAAVLAARAALRSGAGLLTVHVPACGVDILQTTVPEAMVSRDRDGARCIASCPALGGYTAVGIGPGIGKEGPVAQALKVLIQESRQPLVLDADALNILSAERTWLAFLPKGSILTPHPGEFDRLAGKASGDYDRYLKAKTFALKHQVYVVLKGGITLTVSPDGRCFFNSTGNPGMATAGSGDTLTGILTGLLAQGYSNLHACILGVYLHGLAGDMAAEAGSEEGMIAGDIGEQLPAAFNRLRNKFLVQSTAYPRSDILNHFL